MIQHRMFVNGCISSLPVMKPPLSLASAHLFGLPPTQALAYKQYLGNCTIILCISPQQSLQPPLRRLIRCSFACQLHCHITCRHTTMIHRLQSRDEIPPADEHAGAHSVSESVPTCLLLL